jgi:hypothetical protein
MKMAQKVSQRGAGAGSMRRILEGYLLIARQSGDVLSAVVIDLPAWLCLIGRHINNGQYSHSRYYVQTLDGGRDTYLAGTLTEIPAPQTSPLVTAGSYAEIGLGVSGTQYAATRYWGLAQPFNGVGALHAYSAVDTSTVRWPMAYAGTDSSFIWRLIVAAPSAVRFEDGAAVPESPSSAAAGWTLDIGEAVLAAVGAKAITRLQDAPSAGFELNWEGAQYPWLATGRPEAFTSDDGVYGYRITVAANVVYEEAGPYYWYDTPARPDEDGAGVWVETSTDSPLSGGIGGVPGGAKGLWAADIEVLGDQARIVNSYRSFAQTDDRTPLLRDRSALGATGKWYLNNLTYRAPMSTVLSEDGTRTSIMVSSTFVDKTPDGFLGTGNTAKEFDGRLFLDITWLDGGVIRRQNLIETELERGVFHPGQSSAPYYGGSIAFDIGDADEGRFTIGSDTDGTVAVFPVFSAFQPGEMPRLRVFVASRDSVRIGYDGVPGFAMCTACATGEQAIVNYGVVDLPDGQPAQQGEWITLPAPYDHVTFLGNNKYVFYVSSELSERPADNFFWAPGGNIAVATYSTVTDEVAVQGVIDPEVVSNGFGAESPYSASQAYNYIPVAHLVPVFASSAKLGRIEVVRPESDGYDATNPKTVGHPATLIASKGYGQPGLNLEEFDGQDIKQGITWISYDSGATWTQMLNYGSPAGTIHCGNIAQARTEPVVRI